MVFDLPFTAGRGAESSTSGLLDSLCEYSHGEHVGNRLRVGCLKAETVLKKKTPFTRTDLYLLLIWVKEYFSVMSVKQLPLPLRQIQNKKKKKGLFGNL